MNEVKFSLVNVFPKVAFPTALCVRADISSWPCVWWQWSRAERVQRVRVCDMSTLQPSRAHWGVNKTKQSQASSKCAIEHSLTIIFILLHLYLLLLEHQAYLHIPIGFIINTSCKVDKRDFSKSIMREVETGRSR